MARDLNIVELKILINRCYQAVNESDAGPILTDRKNEQGDPIICHIGYQTYLALVNNLIPKGFNNLNEMSESK